MVFGCVAAFGIASVSSPADAHEGAAHGNHDPHHGGVVMMYGTDLHYELVVLPAGNVSIYFTDAQRGELPASVVSDVAIEIERPGSKPETVTMAIGATGECWEGRAAPVKEVDTTLHLAFVFQGEPVVMSFPASSLLTANKAAGDGKEAASAAHDAGASQHGH
jgi:hypothetical protein